MNGQAITHGIGIGMEEGRCPFAFDKTEPPFGRAKRNPGRR